MCTRAALAMVSLTTMTRGAVEPSRFADDWPRMPILQHVLPIEMGTLPVRRRDGMDDGRLPRPEQTVQMRHRGIECKEAIERQCRLLSCGRQGAVATQRRPLRVADGRDRAQPIEATTQHDHEQTRVPAVSVRQARRPRANEPASCTKAVNNRSRRCGK